MRWLIVILTIGTAAAAAVRFRRREPTYAYGRWRDGDAGMPRIVPVIDVP